MAASRWSRVHLASGVSASLLSCWPGLLSLVVDVSALPQESLLPFLAVGLFCLAVDVPALPQESPLPFLAVGLF